MAFRFALIFLLLLSLYLGAHLAVYLGVVRFFLINDQRTRLILAGIFALLSLGFIAVLFLSHRIDLAAFRVLYFGANVWVGLLVNLLFATIGTALFFPWFQLIGWEVSERILAIIFFSGAVAFSSYGWWNAQHFQIHPIDVTIPNLPESWDGKVVVQISDVHLGHINRPEFMDRIAVMVNDQRPELVAITGDLLDGMDGELEIFLPVLKKLQANQGVYFITGNHETYLGADKAYALMEQAGIYSLKNEKVELNGLQLLGVSYPERNELNFNPAQIVANIPGYDSQSPSILLYHAPTNISDIKATGVNLELTGHTHHGQLWPFGYVTHLIFKGYDVGLFPEENYTLYSSNGVGTWGPPMRTGNTPEIVKITLHRQ